MIVRKYLIGLASCNICLCAICWWNLEFFLAMADFSQINMANSEQPLAQNPPKYLDGVIIFCVPNLTCIEWIYAIIGVAGLLMGLRMSRSTWYIH